MSILYIETHNNIANKILFTTFLYLHIIYTILKYQHLCNIILTLM